MAPTTPEGRADLLANPVVPVAGEDDARGTARGLARLLGPDDDALFVYVVEKAGGAPDKAGVAQREAVAAAAFDAARAVLGPDRVRSAVLYGTDVAETVFGAAEDADASAVVFTPRGGSRWARLLTGDVALDLVTDAELPVVAVPDEPPTGEDGGGDDAADGGADA